MQMARSVLDALNILIPTIGCRYNGRTYEPGESFPSNDAQGCSTW